MIALARPFNALLNSVALPASLLIVGVMLVGSQLDVPQFAFGNSRLAGPEQVTLAPADFTYRAAGHFLRDGIPVDAPMLQTRLDAPLTIMKYQVRAADYAACVADGACAPAEPRHIGKGNIPVTGVNYDDATDYAAWLSGRTGENWELPTDEQWAFAAGAGFADDALGLAADNANPAARWLASYEKEAARNSEAGRTPLPLGSFGSNENGVADMGGNVWEWTQTCHRRVHVDAAGAILSETPACTIKILDGQHRTPMSFFIRDAKSGGCSVGIPPANLGFRLVRQPAWHETLRTMLHL
ncbi:SUMF1/EgtB/PvdO family nonheme iron enzyme [Devosia beringensis]|uniref:SUMF1/EgtB/PvdO family nonheme iron enzyme n=1 Tax=Devosia beringensis TaxID=2657486 RepID=UPI00186B5BE3|nr:SUMF1/EgtB/PvdO family nonheme iron enzyme [Devosia beringensis]